jgi:hypothetical protein
MYSRSIDQTTMNQHTFKSPPRGKRLWIALALIVVALVLWLAWFANLDEELLPGVQEAYAEQRVLPDEKNIYYAVVGLTAPLDKDPATVGREMVAAINAQIERQGLFTEFDEKRFLESGLNITSFQLGCTTQGEDKRCLAFEREHAAEIAADMQRLAPYAARYRALRTDARAGSGFEERAPTSITALVPNMLTLSAMSRLVRADALLSVQNAGQREAALRELADEVLLWRTIYAGASTYVPKQTARAALLQNLERLSELLTETPVLASTHNASIAALTRPIAIDEISLAKIMRAEFQYRARIHQWTTRGASGTPSNLHAKTGVPNWSLPYTRFFYRENATINQAFRDYQQTLALAKRSPVDLLDEKLLQEMRQSRERDPTSASTVFNPMGDMAHEIMRSSMEDVILSAHDAVTFSRAVEVQRQIAANRVASENVNTFIASLGASLHNPYTEAPFVFDAATSTITFDEYRDGRAKAKKRVIKIAFTK